MQRRTVLRTLGAGAAAVAGCTGAAPAPQSAPSEPRRAADPWVDITTPTNGNGLNWRADFQLAPGYFAIREYQPEQPIGAGYEVETDGTPIDVLLVAKSEAEYRAYVTGDDFEHLDRGTSLDGTVLKTRYELEAGSYVLISITPGRARRQEPRPQLGVSSSAGTAVVPAARDRAGVATQSRPGLGQFYGAVLNSVMTFANKEGTLLVIAAGNDASDLQHDKNLISLPNEGAQGVSVSATGPVGYGWDAGAEEAPPQSPAYYTNYGTNAITLGAPGGDVSLSVLDQLIEKNDDNPENDEPIEVPWFYDLVFNAVFTYKDTDGDGEPDTQVPAWGWKAGTSMAAPQVAGAAALVKSANPGYNANQVEAALTRAADVPDGYPKRYYGSGFVNVVDAL